MASFLRRYQQGEHEQVWAELSALGAEACVGSLGSDAWAVALETMRRTRHNIKYLIPRLQAVGYEFGYVWASLGDDVGKYAPPIFALPLDNASQRLSELERLVGSLPLSLRAFYETVGAVNFVGKPPAHWMLDHRRDDHTLDPLYIYPIEIAFEEYESWREMSGEDGTVRYAFPIAPDSYHKYGISGGMWYHMSLPQLNVDGMLEAERHHTTFVNYLRTCFRWGGLPGLEYFVTATEKDLPDLVEGLLPIWLSLSGW